MVKYRAITDWSLEGRQAFVAEHNTEVRLLLDLAFTEFIDAGDVPLSAFRFGRHGGDPVDEAVEWCVQRFRTADLDPGQLRAGSRSTRLFTEVSFWLSQRETKNGYKRILAEWSGRTDRLEQQQRSGTPHRDPRQALNSAAVGEGASGVETATNALQRRLGRTLSTLARRTCADLVTAWLVGTSEIRAEWFGWDESPGEAPDWSPKQRSLHVADSLFRFFVLYGGLQRHASKSLAVATCVVALFSPCENQPPYRLADSTVSDRQELDGPREAGRLRRTGTADLVRKCLAIARDNTSPVDAALARAHLRSSVLHKHKLDDHADLKAALRGLPTTGASS